MTDTQIKTTETAGAPKATLNIDPVIDKPGRNRIPPKPAEKKQEPETTKWVKLVKGGTYGYKRAIYTQDKVYEVSLEDAEHLLAQSYTIGGNGQETVDVYYFQEVPKKKK